MKIRQGFVSNSSSSSFLLIGTQKAIDDAMEKLDDFGREVLNCTYLRGGSEIILDGKPYRCYFGEISDDDFAYDAIHEEMERRLDDPDGDKYEYYDEAREKCNQFTKEFKQKGGIVKFSH